MNKRVPGNPVQHQSAGPYSPVLEIDLDQRLILLSGQVAISLDGSIIGSGIEEQTRATFENCRRLLRDAGCTLDDVFKVNVFLADINDWAVFNTVYETFFSRPYPVRTAVQAVLLPGFSVEVELWATTQKTAIV